MRADELIVGFDAREMWQEFNSSRDWSPSRKERMLIRQDITKTLSPQRYVWLRVFEIVTLFENGEGKLFQDSRRRMKEPQWKGILGLWENLQILKDNLNSGWGDEWEPCWLVTITVLFDSEEERAYWT